MRDLKAVVRTDTAVPDASPFLCIWAMTHMTGLGRSTIYGLIAQDKFPSPVRLANRAIVWHRTDLERWSEASPTVTH